ncbi:MAG: vanadium-dependent haloperoxidase, partial [Candidatus Binatia bacterium]
LGESIGQAIGRWIAGDGFGRFGDCAYTAPVGPGLWRPTPPAFVSAPLQPCWGSLRPFVFRYRAECAPPPPPSFSTDVASAFHASAREVYDTFHSLDAEQKFIAEFWADGPGQTGTPPGHWIDIVRQISERQPLDLGTSAEAFARVGIAVADAFNRCWKTKYTHNVLRPVTYIRDHIDASFLPFLTTPPFPEYTSGHSTQSGAVSVVLGDLLGDDYAFVDTTSVDHATPPATPRSFPSFRAAAEEAALSRLYGGIHYRFGNDNGLAQGICIGHTILERVRFRR